MASDIRAQIDARFRQARLDRDEKTKNVIGMLKAKVLNELKSGRGSDETDALWLETLQSYAKQLRKTIAEYEQLGRGEDLLEEARFELEFCRQFLPEKLDEAATEALVRRLAAEHGVSDPKMQGKLMGVLMKEHKNEIDGNLARRIVQRVLAERT